MATVKSPIINYGSGSVGGITYTRGPNNQLIFRAKSFPVNPNTPEQQYIRNAFGQASLDWETITPALREAWGNYAGTLTWLNSIGDPYTPKGRMVFIQVRSFLDYLTLRSLNPYVSYMAPGTEPGTLTVPAPEAVAPVTVGIGFGLSFVNNNLYAVNYLISRSAQVSMARNYYKGPYLPSTSVVVLAPAETTTVVDFMDLVDGGRYPWVARGFKQGDVPLGNRLATILRGIATAEETTV